MKIIENQKYQPRRVYESASVYCRNHGVSGEYADRVECLLETNRIDLADLRYLATGIEHNLGFPLETSE